MKITDAQIHLWSGTEAPPHHPRAPFTIDRAIREMNEAGIDRAINCPAIWDADSNTYATEAALAHPDRFATMGCFPLNGTSNADAVDVLMSQPGMLGLRFVLYAPPVADILRAKALDWLWQRADERALPVSLMVMPEHLVLLHRIADDFPRMRLLLDHLALGPFDKLPVATAHIENLLSLARHGNVAAKATGVMAAAPEGFPFPSTHDLLRRTFDAFGPERTFWGTDITRQQASWSECVSLFTQHLSWLEGEDLELVMGRGVSDWIGWS